MILGCEAIIYQYQWDLLQGDTGGAVRYFDGVHLFKEVAFRREDWPFFIRPALAADDQSSRCGKNEAHDSRTGQKADAH